LGTLVGDRAIARSAKAGIRETETTLKNPPLDVEAVAERVAEGVVVNWDEALESASDDRERRLIRQLQLVAGVAEVHRGNGQDAPARERSPELTATVGSSVEVAIPAVGSWSRLELRERLGRGGFGEVYRAWDPQLEREVALKLLDPARAHGPAAASAAVEEGRLLARLRHPNVVTVYGAEIREGRVGIWMELIRGRSLDQVLRSHGPLGAREAALVGIDLCRALAAAHRAGVIHRDVKAENVLREEGGRIVLTDFGAGIETGAPSAGGATSVSGTPLYMAPELIRGERASGQSDLYALGVLLYHLVTGAYPVSAGSWSDLEGKHARRERRLLRDERPDLPAGFVRAVEGALAWDPSERLASAGQLEQALAASLDAEVPATAIPAQSPKQATARRRFSGRALAALGATVLVVALAVLGGRALLDRGAGSAAEGYEVFAALYRAPSDAAARERIEQGSMLALGDRLTLEFKASAPLHVYVIDEDDEGHAYALFPLPGFEPRNPLPAGAALVLPGTRDGKSLAWTVDTAGGREHLIVLASPTRLVEFEAEMNGLAKPGQTAVPLPETARVRLRGVGGLAEAPPEPAPKAPSGAGRGAGLLFDMARQLASGSERVRGVWLRRIDLENPRPAGGT
jgi:eukaryotic-like serine/threonine-protein kinase